MSRHQNAQPSAKIIRARVTRAERLSPSFVQVTIHSSALEQYPISGNDQWFRMFFKRPAQPDLWLPESAGPGWMLQTLLTPARTRPWVRAYTVRAFRREVAELDILIAVHGHESPASYFAQNVVVGDEVGILDEGAHYSSPPAHSRTLFVADASALPAVLAIMDHPDPLRSARVVLEVPTSEDILAMSAVLSDETTWIANDSPHARPGLAALDYVRSTDLGQIDRAWAAGESRLATGVRRHLVQQVGLHRSRISFSGYWRDGIASPG